MLNHEQFLFLLVGHWFEWLLRLFAVPAVGGFVFAQLVRPDVAALAGLQGR